MTLAEVLYESHGKHQAEQLTLLGPEDAAEEAKAEALQRFHVYMQARKADTHSKRLTDFTDILTHYYEQVEEHVEELLAVLPSTDYLSRGFVASLLGYSAAPEARTALYRLIESDPSPLVRQHAAAALGKHATEKDRQFLLGLLATPAPKAPNRAAPWESIRDVVLTGGPMDLRSGAAEALGDAKATEAVESLLALIHDPSLLCQSAAIRALGNIGDPQSLVPLEALHSQLVGSTERRSTLVSTAIKRALTQLQTSSSVGSLPLEGSVDRRSARKAAAAMVAEERGLLTPPSEGGEPAERGGRKESQP